MYRDWYKWVVPCVKDTGGSSSPTALEDPFTDLSEPNSEEMQRMRKQHKWTIRRVPRTPRNSFESSPGPSQETGLFYRFNAAAALNKVGKLLSTPGEEAGAIQLLDSPCPQKKQQPPARVKARRSSIFDNIGFLERNEPAGNTSKGEKGKQPRVPPGKKKVEDDYVDVVGLDPEEWKDGFFRTAADKLRLETTV